MTTRRQTRRWADSESAPATAPAPLPVQTTFRHMPSSPAVVARVETEAQKLQRYFDRIQRCRVVVIAPHLHQRQGRRYSLHVELDVPGERLVIDHQPPSPRRVEVRHLSKGLERQPEDKDIYLVIRHVFDAARRRLEDYVRRMRGDVKRHEAPAALPK